MEEGREAGSSIGRSKMELPADTRGNFKALVMGRGTKETADDSEEESGERREREREREEFF